MPRRKIVRSVPQTSSVIDMKTGMPVSPPSIPVICERIRYFRELAGIEQKELGKKIGISPNTISNWETGRSRPDINLIPAICGALQVSLSEERAGLLRGNRACSTDTTGFVRAIKPSSTP